MSDLTPQQRIENDVKAALKEGDKARLATLRMLLGAIKNRRIELGEDVDEDELITLVKRAVKQRKESADQYRQGDRLELAEKEESEIAHLEVYLPAQADEATVRDVVAKIIAEQGAEGPKAMGGVMKAAIAHFGGAADGKLISQVARELLN